MDLSLFIMLLHDMAKSYQRQLGEDMEAFILADEPITSPAMFFANLISRTKRIKFVTGVICLPQYHPALVAGQAAMFDHLSQGRFIFGIGTGGLQSDFELFGTDKLDRAVMLRAFVPRRSAGARLRRVHE
jgi:alkanesulfonate monooxygenase SsuD/methylene tetrahydromethanopterin reductase-like flavin-dependent oxidoreductase (luciferase family)